MSALKRLSDVGYPLLPIFAQNWVCSAAGYTRFRTRFGRHFRRRLAELEESVHWDVERLHALQRTRLDALIRRAREHVPYYRDLGEPSAAPEPLAAIRETLAAIPPLEKWVY